MGRAQGIRPATDVSTGAARHSMPPAEDADTRYDRLCEENADWLSGWAGSHDYDPTWDYHICFEHRQHPLYLLACQVMADVCARGNPDVPFATGRVYPAQLEGAVARYVSGTSAEPVVLIDIEAHLVIEAESERRGAVADSVLHELRHAVQEDCGWELDEDEAEHSSTRMPF